MLSTERETFEGQLAVLFGAYPTFLTPPRVEAYWRGLQKMPLSTFVRCVDQALSEAGQEKLPTVNTIWQISRNLHVSARQLQTQRPEPDALNCHGQRVMLSFLRHQESAASEASLLRMIAAKNKLIEQYRWIVQEETEAAGELRDKLWDALAAQFEPPEGVTVNRQKQVNPWTNFQQISQP